MQLIVILGLTHPGNKASRNLLERVNFEQDLSYAYVSKEEAGEDAVYFLVR
jgi:hypothetical protein